MTVKVEVVNTMFTGDMQHLQGLRKRIIEELRSEILVTRKWNWSSRIHYPRAKGRQSGLLTTGNNGDRKGSRVERVKGKSKEEHHGPAGMYFCGK